MSDSESIASTSEPEDDNLFSNGTGIMKTIKHQIQFKILCTWIYHTCKNYIAFDKKINPPYWTQIKLFRCGDRSIDRIDYATLSLGRVRNQFEIKIDRKAFNGELYFYKIDISKCMKSLNSFIKEVYKTVRNDLCGNIIVFEIIANLIIGKLCIQNRNDTPQIGVSTNYYEISKYYVDSVIFKREEDKLVNKVIRNTQNVGKYLKDHMTAEISEEIVENVSNYACMFNYDLNNLVNNSSFPYKCSEGCNDVLYKDLRIRSVEQSRSGMSEILHMLNMREKLV
jgi:hypothetical protein